VLKRSRRNLKTKGMKTKITDLSRIDRAVADNLSDIRMSFDDHAGIVQDFIVFITQQMKYDLFGYTRFTMKDFCKASGRNRQDLAVKHPMFRDGKKKPPTVDGYGFETVFDYALFVMMKNNLIFSKAYETKEEGRVIELESIRILSDVRLNINRKTKDVKLYEVKVSSEMLNGFIKRYYTLDAKAYMLAGKGRGGDNRKSLLIYLSRIRHILFSKGETAATIPVDVLAEKAGLKIAESFNRKLSVDRMLKHLRDKAKFPFAFSFVRPSVGAEAYYVKLVFEQVVEIRQLRNEHGFYYALVEDLKSVFESKYGNMELNMKEPFQRWLNNPSVDTDIKISIIRRMYYKFFAADMTNAELYHILQFGFVEKDWI